MEHSRKMVLLPEDSYRYLASQSFRKDPLQTTQTVGNNLTRRDDELHQVLESNLHSDEKWKKYEQLLNRFLFYKNPLKRKLHSCIDDDENEDNDDSAKNDNGIAIDKIISSLPKTFKRNGSNLLDFITNTDSNRKITWNERGIVKIDNKEIPGSNIIDLVNDVVRTRKTFSAVGKDAFADVLKEIGVPREFIGNSDLVKVINKSTESSNFDRSLDDKTLRRNNSQDSTLDNFHSFANGTNFNTVSTPKPVRKRGNNQSGSGWLTLNF